jgi:hypothetical protein
MKMRFTRNVAVDYSEFGGSEASVGSSRDPWGCRAPCSAPASDPRQSSKAMGFWPSAGGREDGREEHAEALCGEEGGDGSNVAAGARRRSGQSSRARGSRYSKHTSCRQNKDVQMIMIHENMAH